MRSIQQPLWWSGVRGAGVGLLGAAVIGPVQLAEGGLSPLLVAVALGLVLGVPLAQSMWGTTSSGREQSVVLFVYWMSLAAAAAQDSSPVLSLLPWVAAALLSWSAFVGWVALAGLVLVIFSLPAALWFQPWEFLQPSLRTPLSWLPIASTAGLLASWVPGYWSGEPRRRIRLPEVGAGLALFALGAMGVVFAASLITPRLTGLGRLVQLSLVAVAATVFMSARSTRFRTLSILGGAVASVAFSLLGGMLFWWSTTAPLLLGGVCLSRAARTHEIRWAVAALYLGVVVVFGFQGIPESIGEALMATLPIVGVYWFVGLRALQRNP